MNWWQVILLLLPQKSINMIKWASHGSTPVNWTKLRNRGNYIILMCCHASNKTNYLIKVSLVLEILHTWLSKYEHYEQPNTLTRLNHYHNITMLSSMIAISHIYLSALKMCFVQMKMCFRCKIHTTFWAFGMKKYSELSH